MGLSNSWRVFVRENPTKLDDLGVALFQETSTSVRSKFKLLSEKLEPSPSSHFRVPCGRYSIWGTGLSTSMYRGQKHV